MHSPERSTLRRTTTAVVALALSATLVSPAFADTTAASLLGPAELILIESVHAAGKVVEIGDDAAQTASFPGSTERAAAAVFTMATTGAELRDQAIAAYPVLEAEGVYVLASQDGEVLSRRSDDGDDYRYLEISELGLEQAALEPAAQWRMREYGDGTRSLLNGKTDRNGRTAGLDLYNWATADASEVQTYDAGDANVQRWRIRDLEPAVADYAAIAQQGVVPELPGTMTATYDWGRRHSVDDIVWQLPDETVWGTDGEVVVAGSGTGWFGERLDVRAVFQVGSLGDAVDTTASGYAGMTLRELQMLAPSTVQRSLSGGEATVSAAVTWDWSAVNAEALAEPGELVVPATASTGFAARFVVTLRPAVDTNILRAGGVHTAASFGSAGGLTDGDRSAEGYSTWRSGGAANRVNPATINYYLDVPRVIDRVGVYDSGSNIGQVTVQYRDLLGGWIDLPAADVTWPAVNTSGALAFEASSDPVLATGLRVTVEHKSSATWMTLAEIEAWGPQGGDAA